MVLSPLDNDFSSTTAFVATLGGQPQVLTFALDDLRRRGEAIDEVHALHLSLADARLRHAIQQLQPEFAGNRYQGQPCRFRHVNVETGPNALQVVDDEHAAEAVWRTVNQLIAGLKQRGRRIHLCVTGGPRMIGLLAMSVATLHFDHQDCLWHLYTPRPYRLQANEGAILHADEGAGVRLIRVPMAPWGAYFPALRSLTQASSDQVMAAQARWQSGADRTCCRTVVERLSPRQTEVLRAFAGGLAPQDVAEQLVVSLKTVDSHKTVILAECRIAWGLDEGERLTYHFLREKFGPFYEKG